MVVACASVPAGGVYSEGRDRKEWSRLFKSWVSRFCKGEVGKAMKVAKDKPKREADAEALGLHNDLLDIGEDTMCGMATELYHTLTLFTKGKAAKIVTTVVEGEGFEAR